MFALGLGRNHSGRLIGFARWYAALALPIGVLADPQQDAEQTIAVSQTTLRHETAGHERWRRSVMGTCQSSLNPSACEPAIPAERGGGFMIGGAVFEDAADPLMSGVDDVTVTVRRTGGNGVFSTTTNPLGLWRIDDVPTGTYRVSFRPAARHARGPKRPMKISVNEENKAANLSIKWLVGNSGGRP